MGMEELIGLVGTVGFPIAVSTYLLVTIGRTQTEQNKILTELSLLIKGLYEKVEKLWEE